MDDPSSPEKPAVLLPPDPEPPAASEAAGVDSDKLAGALPRSPSKLDQVENGATPVPSGQPDERSWIRQVVERSASLIERVVLEDDWRPFLKLVALAIVAAVTYHIITMPPF